MTWKEVKRKMLYAVTVKYMDFYFADRGEALDFAEIAFTHSEEDIDVKIRLIKDPKEAEA
jgi:hypothetical protein